MAKSQTQQAVEAITEATGHTGGKLMLTKTDRDAVVARLYSNHE